MPSTTRTAGRPWTRYAAVAILAVACAAASSHVPQARGGPTPRPAASGFAPVNGLRLYYEIHGAGRPLVMLHGGVNPDEMLGAPLLEMAKTMRVVAVHLQAHGRTRDVDRPLSYETMADDIAGLLKYLGIAEAAILGYSMGAGVALQVAVRHPEIVTRLIVVSMPFSSAGFFPEVQAAFQQMPAHAARIADAIRHSPLAVRFPDVEWATLFTKLGRLNAEPRDWSADVPRITAPTLLMFADADAVRPEHAVAFYRLLGGGLRDPGQDGAKRPVHRLAIIPGRTHYDLPGSPLVTQLAAEFLGR